MNAGFLLELHLLLYSHENVKILPLVNLSVLWMSSKKIAQRIQVICTVNQPTASVKFGHIMLECIMLRPKKIPLFPLTRPTLRCRADSAIFIAILKKINREFLLF